MFIASKRCKFAGQLFRAGETIPAELILPTAVNRLKRIGLIAEVSEAGPLLPASTSLEGTSSDGSEEDSEKTVYTEEDSEKTVYTEAELMEKKRDELAGLAAELGMDVTDKHTKAMLTAYILEHTGSDE